MLILPKKSYSLMRLFFSIFHVDLKSVNKQQHFKEMPQKKLETSSDPAIMKVVQAGSLLALEHCQSSFRWDKWNCPKDDFEDKSNKRLNREFAYIQAIFAAGIVHKITKHCSKGELPNCGCNPKMQSSVAEYVTENKNSTWSWGGCSDDITFGNRVAKELLEQPLNYSKHSFVANNNYRVGRDVVKHSLRKKCRCHGVSGSCSLQTCWLQQVPFHEIARKLKERYQKAHRLNEESVEMWVAGSNSVKREESQNADQLTPKNGLVYLEDSPNYCFANDTYNWPGTEGRACSKSKHPNLSKAERLSCKTLCKSCGHQVKKATRTVKTRCNCSFEYCCTVKCDTCTEIQEDYYCD
ncbi:hypothetical protein ABEB36_012544 [Hypothenemus hampei]|uniref:Protein Wnt n=1 Tax=Hypothenemus hampei TaxID=57062 RepID=A0ABD1EBK5_HYPHA